MPEPDSRTANVLPLAPGQVQKPSIVLETGSQDALMPTTPQSLQDQPQGEPLWAGDSLANTASPIAAADGEAYGSKADAARERQG